VIILVTIGVLALAVTTLIIGDMAMCGRRVDAAGPSNRGLPQHVR
jgi:hypothetical protein